MAQQILVCARQESFLVNVNGLVNDLPYAYRFASSPQDVENIERGYVPTVVIFEGIDRVELTNFIDAVWKRYKSTSRLVVMFENRLPFSYDDLGTRKLYLTFLQRPFEDAMLLDYLLENAPVEIPNEQLKIEHLFPVRISDIKANDHFPFDLFFHMAANKKFLLYRKKNSVLTPDQIKKFQDHFIYDLYIKKTEARAYNEHITKSLKSVFENKKIPITKKRMELQKKVRDIFCGFFDSSTPDPMKSRAILNTCKQVVGQFITDISPNPEIFEQILKYTIQMHSNYNHAVNVSVFASLFALGLGSEDVESAAIGGMLHDIGLSVLPTYITDKPVDKLPGYEAKIYNTHPLEGTKLLRNKKVLGTDAVFSIIEQHHEYMDGTGYPRSLTKDYINPLTRLVQIADELDELTSMSDNKEVMSPNVAMGYLIKNNTTQKGGERLDGELLKQLNMLFRTPSDHPISIEQTKSIFSTPAAPPKSTDLDTDSRRRKRLKRTGF